MNQINFMNEIVDSGLCSTLLVDGPVPLIKSMNELDLTSLIMGHLL